MSSKSAVTQVVPVVLSGGQGTRLWPLSRASYPKQFFDLAGENSMLQETLLRARDSISEQSPIIVCSDDNRFLVAEQLRKVDIPAASIVLEPVGRNTAPAAAVAALKALTLHDDPVLVFLPADHVISDIPSLEESARAAIEYAEQGYLVTFGVVPAHAETGYGYILAGEELGQSCSVVDRFVEKPDLPTAEGYVNDGRYLWNSGMFVFRASCYLEELEKYRPEILQACRNAVESADEDLDFLRLDSDAFQACPDDSIDYAVMEHTDRAAVVSLQAGWSDVGSWASLADVCAKDGAGNVVRGDVVLSDVENCLVRSESRLVAALGLSDTVVVETADAVLIAAKERVQDVKKIVHQLKTEGRDEATTHRRMFRPWGSYESIGQYERAQVKLISVKPGQRLSLQMHHHRAEHWIVISGTARVTRGEDEFLLGENESTFIPLGVKHRLENPGNIALELIEVQSGSYLGEDDIIRFEDVYGRVGEDA